MKDVSQGTDRTPVERADQSRAVTTHLAPLRINLHTLDGLATGLALQLESLCILRVC